MPTDADPVPSLPVYSASPVDHAVRVLAAGGVVAYPTETVWGLAAHPASRGGVQRLVGLKGRDPGKPLQVSCVDAATALTLAADDPALRVLASWWPGPVTVVTPASPRCPAEFAPGGRVGLRVPDYAVARALLGAAGGLLITTSCNAAGQPPAVTFGEAVAVGLADFVLPDGGVGGAGLASTVVALPGVTILREGSVPARDIRARLAAAGIGTGAGS